MNESLFHPMLAVDPGTIIIFIFMMISFFGWIGKQIKAANENAGRPKAGRERIGGAGRPREQPLQNEIDAFLEDVLGHDPRQAADQERHQQEQEQRRRQQAAVERERARTRQASQQKQKRKPARPSQKKTPTPRPAQPLGQGLQSHVETFMSPHLDHLEPNVERHVQSHLGVAEGAVTTGGEKPVNQQLISMLQSPQGMRQVILLNEIFSKPKSQR